MYNDVYGRFHWVCGNRIKHLFPSLDFPELEEISVSPDLFIFRNTPYILGGFGSERWISMMTLSSPQYYWEFKTDLMYPNLSSGVAVTNTESVWKRKDPSVLKHRDARSITAN